MHQVQQKLIVVQQNFGATGSASWTSGAVKTDITFSAVAGNIVGVKDYSWGILTVNLPARNGSPINGAKRLVITFTSNNLTVATQMDQHKMIGGFSVLLF